MIHQDDLSSLKIDREPLPARPHKPNPMMKILSALLFMAVGAGGMWLVIGKRAEVQKESQNAVKPAANGGGPSVLPSAPSTLTASGYIVSKHKSVLSSKVSGRVLAIHVEEGSPVTKGQLLVEIDDRELQAQLQVERADLKKAQIDFERGKKVFESGLISPAEYDHLQVTLEQEQERVKLLDTQVSETKILAPFDGVVLKKNQEVGEMTSGYGNGNNSSSTDGILTVADLAHMEAEVDVEEKYDNQIEVGQPAEVVAIEAYADKKFQGIVDRKGAFDRAKRTRRVIVTILNPERILQPDMNAKVTFLEKAKDKKKEEKK